MKLLSKSPSKKGFTLKTRSGASEKSQKGFTLISRPVKPKPSGFTLIGKPVKAKSYGFTLIELLVVIAILGILLTVGINLWQRAVVNARDQVRRQDLNQLKTAFEQYHQDKGYYPVETCQIGECSGPMPTFTGGDSISCVGSAGGHRGIGFGHDPFDCDGVIYMDPLPGDVNAGFGGSGQYCFNAQVIGNPDTSSDFFEIWAVMENPNNGNTTDTAECLNEGTGFGQVHYNYVIKSDL